MKMMQRIRCLFGAHHRSRRNAWDDEGTYRSPCEGCGRQMIRGPGGHWSLVPLGEEHQRSKG